MCIRDSLTAGRYENRVIVTAAVPIFDTNNKRVIGVLQLAPVSYTHLRAHETVLDLVCRLLLEKKKETNLKEKSPIIYVEIMQHRLHYT